MMPVWIGDIEKKLEQLFGAADAGRCEHSVFLSRYAAEDLSQEEDQAFRFHLAHCDECQADLETFHRVESIWDEDRLQVRPLRKPVLPSWLTPLRLWAAAGAALLLLALLVLLPLRVSEDSPGKLMGKGAWQLHVAAERSGQTFRVVDGSHLLPGDRLGFFYSSARPGYLMLLYSDNPGGLVRLFPALKPESSPITPGEKISLPDGAVVSDGQGCEWIVGLFSKNPFSFETAQEGVGRMIKAQHNCRLDTDTARLPGLDLLWLQVNR